MLSRANPDGDEVRRALFASAISAPIASALLRRLVADAFRRILTVGAMKAVIRPPAKRAKRQIPPASTPDLSASAPPTSAAALAAGSSAAGGGVADDSGDDVYDFADDDGVVVVDDVSGDDTLSPSRQFKHGIFSRVGAALWFTMSVGRSVCRSVRNHFTFFCFFVLLNDF